MGGVTRGEGRGEAESRWDGAFPRAQLAGAQVEAKCRGPLTTCGGCKEAEGWGCPGAGGRLRVLDPQNPHCASSHKPSPREINMASSRQTEPSATAPQGRPCHQVTSSERGRKVGAGVPRPPVPSSHSGCPGKLKCPRWGRGLGTQRPCIPCPPHVAVTALRGCGVWPGPATAPPHWGAALSSPVTQLWAAEEPQVLTAGGARTPAPASWLSPRLGGPPAHSHLPPTALVLPSLMAEVAELPGQA